jgi:hypothetical protein
MGQISRRRHPTVRGWFAIRLGMAGLLVASAFVLMSAPAMACPVTDLSCLPQTVADPVTAVQDTTTEVVGTATSTVDQTTEVVEQTTAAVEVTVAAITDQANQVVESTSDEVLGSTVTQSSEPDTTASGGNGTTTGSGRVKSRTIHGGGTGLSTFGRGPVIGPVAAPISLTQAASRTIPRQGLLDRIGPLAIEAAKALAFPLALAVIVLLFVAVQNRIDRKDPKLALAPVTPDLLRFE